MVVLRFGTSLGLHVCLGEGEDNLDSLLQAMISVKLLAVAMEIPI